MSRLKKFLMKIKKLYRKTFDPPENEIDFNCFTKLSYFFFRFILLDLHPLNKNASLALKVKFIARKYFKWLLFLPHIIGMMQLLAYGYFHADILDAVLRAVSDSSMCLTAVVKVSTLFLYKDDIRIILEELKTLFKSRNNDHKYTKNKKYLDGYHRIMKFYTFNFIVGNLAVAAFWLPYFLNGSMNYVVNLWFPFDIYESNMFPFVKIWIQLMCYLGAIFVISSDSVLFVLVTAIAMEFDFLNDNLSHFKSQSKDEQKLKIASLINCHNKLFEISDKLQKVFGANFLIGFVISSFIMCANLFHFLFYATNLAMYIFDISYLISTTGQMCLLCFFGQKLIDSSAAVADGIYECDWMDHDNKFKKYVVITMIRGQRPMTLSAMGFADISFETFATVR